MVRNRSVFLWDLMRPLTAIDDSAVMTEYTHHNESPLPICAFNDHASEGFAVDWSHHTSATGYLATGDCGGHIFHWISRPTDWAVSKKAHVGHKNYVEDIQWSPTEPTVFISVSSDHSIQVWDIRAPVSNCRMITVCEAHPADINVASWNQSQRTNFLTGGVMGL
ncbi:unnamed protein product [Heterobilharzia americana]|nr:unnamed protein product [Heterobilharzia americana]